MRHNPVFALLFLFSVCLATFACAQEEPQKMALLVGVSDYLSEEVEDLNYAANDIRVVGSQLKLMGFKVTSLSGKNATRQKTIETIDQFMEQAAELESNDVVFVMFSGHGQQIRVRDESVAGGKINEVPYFCSYDALPFDESKITTRGKSESNIGEELNFVSLNRILRGMDEQSNSLNNLLVVDACRSNPSKGKSAGISGTAAMVPSGVNILFAASSGQKSWESADETIQHGVFTHFLIKGLQGEAKNRHDQVTWSRLVSYLQEEVAFSGPSLAGGKDRVQKPHQITNSNNLIVFGNANTKERIVDRLYGALRNPNDVFEIAGLCNEEEFVIGPVYQAMLLSDEAGCRLGWEILKPHFQSEKLLSLLLSPIPGQENREFSRKEVAVLGMRCSRHSISNKAVLWNSMNEAAEKQLLARVSQLALQIGTARNYFLSPEVIDDVDVDHLDDFSEGLIDSWSEIRSSSNVGLSNSTIEMFENALDAMSSQRGKFRELVKGDDFYHAEWREGRELATAVHKVFDRVKRHLKVDGEYLKSLVPENQESYTNDLFLEVVLKFRAEVALKLNHPMAISYIEDLTAEQIDWVLLSSWLEFSKQFNLSFEIKRACADAAWRNVENSITPPTAFSLIECADWLNEVPPNSQRITHVVALLEDLVPKLEKAVLEENQKKEKGKFSLSVWATRLKNVQQALEQLKRLKEGK